MSLPTRTTYQNTGVWSDALECLENFAPVQDQEAQAGGNFAVDLGLVEGQNINPL
jgi:hypothetical protein